jgi:transcriptional repressor NrdR
MVCPSCHASTRVLESRRAPGGAEVRRRRECSRCGRRFTTFERRAQELLYVIKRDGERQRFDRAKLRSALLNAAHKRPVISSDVELIVDRVEASLVERGELSSAEIGELCMEELRDLDMGAYLQFAGTLEEPAAAISGPPAYAGSVRGAREDLQLPPNAAAKRGFDE